MAGPWEKYQMASTEQSLPSGPWEKYRTPAPTAPKESTAVSFGRNLAQDASLGFSDEIAGGLEAAGRVIGLEGVGGPIKDIRVSESGPTIDISELQSAYNEATKKEREALKKDLKDNPGAAFAGRVTGAILSPASKIKALRGASALKSGAILGGAYGAGTSEADSLSGVATDAVTGAGAGAVIGAVADKALPYVGDKLRDFAGDRAAAALGATKALRKKVGSQKAVDTGRVALDEGVVSWFGSPQKTLDRAKVLKERGGKMMGDVYDKIDDAGASTFNPLEVASKVDEKIGGFWRSPINKGEARQLENTLESIIMRGDKNIPLREAQILKKELDKVANWKNNVNITDKEKMARDAYSMVSEAIDEAAEAGSKQIGIAGLKEKLQKGKKLYSAGKTAEGFLDDKISQQGNNLLGLTDWIALGAGGAYGGTTGDWQTAAGAFAAKKLGQRFGNQMLAKGADTVSKFLLRNPQMQQLSQTNPKAFQATVIEFTKRLESNASLPRTAEIDPGADPNIQRSPGPVIDEERAAEKESLPKPKERSPASQIEPTRPLKGQEKWAHDGAEKLRKHGLNIDASTANPKLKDLLIRASDLSPNSKAMQNVVTQINRLKKGAD